MIKVAIMDQYDNTNIKRLVNKGYRFLEPDEVAVLKIHFNGNDNLTRVFTDDKAILVRERSNWTG